ncbi:MAG: hypothetical protein HRT47_09420 [Candidatus Caenarcaniphilales bacterium]|nr:hypothetical protein [Candidatus Caenarcaniphilales bacterium]
MKPFDKTRACALAQVQGLRKLKNRSLLFVNEDFEAEHNAEIGQVSKPYEEFEL